MDRLHIFQKKFMSKDLHTLRLHRGSRYYFFDICNGEKGLYLKMSCSEKNRSGFDHHRIFIFEEDLNAFVATLNKSAEEMNRRKIKAKTL